MIDFQNQSHRIVLSARSEFLTESSLTINLKITNMIDHFLLHPAMTDGVIQAALQIANDDNVATPGVESCLIPTQPRAYWPNLKVCPAIGFPRANSTTGMKVFEASASTDVAGAEIDMAVNISKVLFGDLDDVKFSSRSLTLLSPVLVLF